MKNLDAANEASKLPGKEESLRYGSSLKWVVEMGTRLLPAIFFLAAVRGKVAELSSFITRPTESEAITGSLAYYVSISSRISVILFLTLMASLFIVREKPLSKASGLSPRLMALAGTFLMSVLTLFPRAELGFVQTAIATSLVLTGTILSIYVLFRLGRSFSLMAEARRLVTTGPYALVRHPLYVAEEIAVIGALIHYLSPATLLIFALHLWIQIQRMKNEEAVLRQTFPAYNTYETTTARLIPGLY